MPSKILKEDEAVGASLRASSRIAAQREEEEEEAGPRPPPPYSTTTSNNNTTPAVPRNDIDGAIDGDSSDDSSDDASDDSSIDTSEYSNKKKVKGKKGAEKNYTKKELYTKLQIERTAVTDLQQEVRTLEHEKNRVVKISMKTSKKFEGKVESLEKKVDKLQKQRESLLNKQSVATEKALYTKKRHEIDIDALKKARTEDSAAQKKMKESAKKWDTHVEKRSTEYENIEKKRDAATAKAREKVRADEEKREKTRESINRSRDALTASTPEVERRMTSKIDTIRGGGMRSYRDNHDKNRFESGYGRPSLSESRGYYERRSDSRHGYDRSPSHHHSRNHNHNRSRSRNHNRSCSCSRSHSRGRSRSHSRGRSRSSRNQSPSRGGDSHNHREHNSRNSSHSHPSNSRSHSRDADNTNDYCGGDMHTSHLNNNGNGLAMRGGTESHDSFPGFSQGTKGSAQVSDKSSIDRSSSEETSR